MTTIRREDEPKHCPFDKTTAEPVSRTELRRRLGDLVDQAIALMDALDGDPDLEESGDEHDTSAWEGWRPGHDAVLPEDDEIDHEGEPSIGWGEYDNQALIATEQTRAVDIESDGGCDDELPCLGHNVVTLNPVQRPIRQVGRRR